VVDSLELGGCTGVAFRLLRLQVVAAYDLGPVVAAIGAETFAASRNLQRTEGEPEDATSAPYGPDRANAADD